MMFTSAAIDLSAPQKDLQITCFCQVDLEPISLENRRYAQNIPWFFLKLSTEIGFYPKTGGLQADNLNRSFYFYFILDVQGIFIKVPDRALGVNQEYLGFYVLDIDFIGIFGVYALFHHWIDIVRVRHKVYQNIDIVRLFFRSDKTSEDEYPEFHAFRPDVFKFVKEVFKQGFPVMIE